MHRWAKARTGQKIFRPVSGAENAAAFRGSIPKYFCPFLRKTAWIIPWKMHAPSDTHLLASWLESRSETGFRALVERYAGLVYMTAKRTCADDALAKEASHLTFITLARKATSLSQRDSLGGWLHVTSRMHARNLVQHRKREALKLERLGTYLETTSPGHAPAAWRKLEPVLDEALAALSTRDREAILLRYYRSLSVREVAVSLSVSVDAAQKRLDRAVDRLRQHLGRRGVATSASLGAVLLAGFASDTSEAASLAPSFASRALKSGPAAGSSALTGLLLMLFARRAVVVAAVALTAGVLVLNEAKQRQSASPPQASRSQAAPFEAMEDSKARLSAAAAQRLRLEEKYGKERTKLSQAVTDQAIQVSLNTQILLAERLIPAIERNKTMPNTAKFDPTLKMSDEQRWKLGVLTASLGKRLTASKKATLERIRENPLPVMEVLLLGDACARGEIPVEEYESRRDALGADLATLENPVELEDEHLLSFGTENPFEDEIFLNGLRELLSPSQLATFVSQTERKLAERTSEAVARRKFLTLASMPPIELACLAKQVGGSLSVLEGVSDNIQAIVQGFAGGR